MSDWSYEYAPDYDRAEAIYRQALAHPDLEDRGDVQDRLDDLADEQAHPEKREEIKQARLRHIQRQKEPQRDPMTLAHGQGSPVHVAACGKRSGAIMDFRTHRPQRGFGRSERSLAKLAEDLTRFLTKAQRSLTYDTLHLSGRQRETLASLLVECAEDLSHDIGIWRSLEAYNRDFFGTPLPCVLQPDETMDADADQS